MDLSVEVADACGDAIGSLFREELVQRRGCPLAANAEIGGIILFYFFIGRCPRFEIKVLLYGDLAAG